MPKNPNSRPDANPHRDSRVQAERDASRRQHENDLAKLDDRPANKGGRK